MQNAPKPNNIRIESAVENFSTALVATKKGVNSIELCENLANGGVTPSYGSVKACVDNLNVSVSVLVRARSGNFVYSATEQNLMLTDIYLLNSLKPNYIVTGALTPNNNLDYNFLSLAVKTSKCPVILHRCFDEIAYSYLQIKTLAQIGIAGVLSAGGKGDFFSGIDNLKKTLAQCNTYNLKLIAAGSITASTLPQAVNMLKPYAFHGKDIV